jgi:hypothetical protein
MRCSRHAIALLACAATSSALLAQAPPPPAANTTPLGPEALPGRGLAEHDFVYAGEWDTRKPDAQSLFVVRGGKITWQTTIPLRTAEGKPQEFDDAELLPNGHILFARMSGAGEYAPDKRLVWEYPAPAGTEIHSIQRIGPHYALLARNGNPSLAVIVDTDTGKTVQEIPIATTTTNTHVQYRHIRMTKRHTIVVPLLGEHRVAEFDVSGREVWSVAARTPWAAERLTNGHTLIAGDHSAYVREVDASGKTVWELTQADVPQFRLFNLQTAQRLGNGHTVICNWVAGHKVVEDWAKTVQVFEVTPDKQVVWALRAWTDPADLGPSTHIQLLDQRTASERVDDWAPGVPVPLSRP